MNGRIKPIKSDIDYHEALDLMEALISANPLPDTDEASQIEILAILIENYEKRYFPLDIPSAVDAIQFRMDQLDLKPSDLVQYLGSASRVSEILSGKRSLTVDMINALSSGLGIPEKALLKKTDSENEYSKNIPVPVFKQMLKRDYFNGINNGFDKSSLIQAFFENHPLQATALYRKSALRTDSKTNHYVLVAWANRVQDKASLIKVPADYYEGLVNLEYMRIIAKYSSDEENGIKKAIAHLLNDGIRVVIEPALEGTKLDGVVIFTDVTSPIIGLTLRYNRLDNFWFTLMHELAHISLHYNSDYTFLYDNLKSSDIQISDIEKEADALASEALVDSSKWLLSAARVVPSPIAASALAKELGVHIVVIAGKARYETGNWYYLASTIKKFTVREKFGDIKW